MAFGTTEVETQILNALLATTPWRVPLDAQLRVAEVVSRRYTGVGFFTEFRVPPEAGRLFPPNLELGSGIFLEIDQVQHGASVVLFVRDGCAQILEASTYDDPWPNAANIRRITFSPLPEQALEAHLPQDIRARTFISNSGELGFAACDIAVVAIILAKCHKTLLGGELWVVRGRDIQAVPRRRTGGNVVLHWETPSRADNEPWYAYAARAASFAEQAVCAFEQHDVPGIEIRPDERIVYNLTWSELESGCSLPLHSG